MHVEMRTERPPVPPRIEVEFETNRVAVFHPERQSIREITEEIKNAQEDLEFRQLLTEYCEDQDDEEDGDGYLAAWDMDRTLTTPVSLDIVREAYMMNSVRNPLLPTRKKFEKGRQAWYAQQRAVQQLERKAKLDPSLQPSLQQETKKLQELNAFWVEHDAKIAASQTKKETLAKVAPAKDTRKPPAPQSKK